MTVAAIAATARAMLRDFPIFFETEVGPLNTLTIRLPHPLIQAASMQVYVATQPGPDPTVLTSTPTTAWQLDDRNGLLKLTDETLLNKRVLISAYHYTWFADADLLMAANQAAEEVVYTSGGDTGNINGIYQEVTAMAAVIRSLWSLATELSLDIDVSTPEGMYIPARQRYQQVLQMMQYWEGQYTTRAESLNIGLGALEIFTLRRVAYLTGRYVPVYVTREVDNPRYPQRIYPPIPDGTMGDPSKGGDLDDVIDVTEALTPEDVARAARGQGAWVSIGTSGSPEGPVWVGL
jgi:hypothetical protein